MSARGTAAAAGLMLAAVAVPSIHSQPSAPSFTRDVAPILFSKCAACHRPTQAAPMSLLSYRDARPWAQAIKRKVIAREMPPWYADPRFGRFTNDPTLTDQEIATIAAWVDGGAIEGRGPLPPLPPYAEGWNHPSGRPPDVVLEMPFEIDVPLQGPLPTLYTFSRPPSRTDAGDFFVEAVQLMPANVPIVHHASFSTRSLPPGLKLGRAQAWPGGPVLDNVPIAFDRSAAATIPGRLPSAAERFSTDGASHFVFYFPGNNGFVQYPAGAGKRVRQQDHFEWGVHYTPNGKRERDKERVGLWWHSAPPTHEVITMRVGDFHIVNGAEIVLPEGLTTAPGHAAVVSVQGTCRGVPCLVDKAMIPPIPPQAANWKITAMTPFQNDATLYLAYPHGHLRLTDMTYVLTYPDGREEIILSVPRFDFNWQLVYRWTRPIKAPAGSTIKTIGHYDNSSANRSNPAPDKEVQWSEQVWDEMFNGFLDLSIDRFDVRRDHEADAPPQAPLVTLVGCAARTLDGGWTLTHASVPVASSIVHADAGEIGAARGVALGTGAYRLVGTAEFGSSDDLLRGDRATFTVKQTANATGSLAHGRQVAVKGLLTGPPAAPLVNLLSVQPLGDQCPGARAR
jgi:hypothetical protein